MSFGVRSSGFGSRMVSVVACGVEGSVVRLMAGVALTLVLAGISTGCGSSSETGDSEADLNLAKSSVLVVGDLPSKWPATNGPRTGLGQDDQDFWTSDLLKCLSVEPGSVGPVTAWASSSAFADSPYGAGSRAEVASSETVAKARIGVLAHTNLVDCLQKSPGALWKSGDPDPGDSLSKVNRIERLNFPKSGDELAAVRMQLTKISGPGAINSGKPYAAVIDLVVVRVGKVLVQLAFGGAGGALPPQWETNMTQVLADRVAESLKSPAPKP